MFGYLIKLDMRFTLCRQVCCEVGWQGAGLRCKVLFNYCTAYTYGVLGCLDILSNLTRVLHFVARFVAKSDSNGSICIDRSLCQVSSSMSETDFRKNKVCFAYVPFKGLLSPLTSMPFSGVMFINACACCQALTMATCKAKVGKINHQK